MTGPKLTATQRDALYGQVLDHLAGIDDLRLAFEHGEFDTADRLAREFQDDLRLILEDLGWGDHAGGSVELKTPPGDLKRIMEHLRDRAIGQYEAERPEQEAFRELWERAALVRSTCEAVLRSLSRAPRG